MRRMLATTFFGLFLALGVGACADSITTCEVECDKARVSCKEKCNDETCRSQCDASFHDCSVKCTSAPADTEPVE